MIKFILPIFLILSSVTAFSDGDADKCMYCGSRAYGACARGPEKLHKHGHGDDKCIWCGSKATGSCARSPFGKHQK